MSKFLFGIAYRQALRARRVGAQVAPVGTTVWAQVPHEQDASGIWDTEWEQSLLDECLRQVRSEFEPATFRAFELTVREGLDAAEAARQLDVPVKSVYNAKHRILKRIRELRGQYETQG